MEYRPSCLKRNQAFRILNELPTPSALHFKVDKFILKRYPAVVLDATSMTFLSWQVNNI